MKRAGIIGGTGPESTIEYYRFISTTNTQLLPGICRLYYKLVAII